MFNITLCKKIFAFTGLLFLISTATMANTVKVLKPLLGFDKRAKFKDELIIRTLEVTEPEFGSFIFESVDVNMTPTRALSSIKSGDLINLFIAPASQIWDNNAIAIKIPIRLGLLSYRLLMINRQDLEKFKNIRTFEQLSQLTAGLQEDWETTKIFRALGMKVATGRNFEGLFLMLNRRRFNYIPRAIYEVYDELDTREDQLANVVVEPTLALYLPMITYIYVSPKAPKIAQRVKLGLGKLFESGELRELLNKYYAQDIQRANLENRHIITIPNTYLNSKEQLNDKYIWLQH